jgi:hypothetical protein
MVKLPSFARSLSSQCYQSYKKYSNRLTEFSRCHRKPGIYRNVGMSQQEFAKVRQPYSEDK